MLPALGDPAVKITPTTLPDVLMVVPTIHRDDRGFFLETYHEARYREHGLDARFVQDNHSRSVRGTLRGLHAQVARPQGKLVRASLGEVLDVAVDIRVGSPTFGRSVSVRLTAAGGEQLWLPEGFAHGFYVLTDEAEIQYKCTDHYDPGSEITIAWNDPELGIAWPTDAPLLSEKDRAAPPLRAYAATDLPAYT